MREDLVKSFVKNASAAGVRCFEPDSIKESHALLQEIIDAEKLIFCPGLTPLEQLVAIPSGKQTPDLTEASAAIEEVKRGIADTGTIVCGGSTRTHLQASLLPEHHIALLFANNIHENFLSLVKAFTILPRNLTLITGPSRTADIEKTLVLGMHGPRRVTVVLLPDA